MTNASLWADLLELAAKSVRPPGQCQGFVGNDACEALGRFVEGYDTANDALAASKALGTFHEGEPPADQVVWVFYDFPVDGHDGLAYGGLVLCDSSQITVRLNPKGTVGTFPLHHYSYALLGWATTNGANTLPNELPAPVPAPANQRTTVAAGGNLRNSAAVVSKPSNIVSTLKGGVAYLIDRYVTGTAPSGTTNATWFATEDGYAWSGDFTDPSTTGITDGDPVTPPVTEPTAPVETTPVTTEPTEPVTPVETEPSTPVESAPSEPTTPVETTPTAPVVVTTPTPVTTPPAPVSSAPVASQPVASKPTPAKPTPIGTVIVEDVNKWLHGGVAAGIIAAAVALVTLCFGH